MSNRLKHIQPRIAPTVSARLHTITVHGVNDSAPTIEHQETP